MKDGFKGERAIVVPQMVKQIIESDYLMSQLYITDIGYYPVAQHHFRCRNTPIDQYVLIWCIAGQGEYTINGQTYDVRPNHYFILPKGIAHSYRANANNPWTIYWIHFSGSLSKYYFPNVAAPQEIAPCAESRIYERIELFEQMYHTLSAGYGIDNLRYVSSLLHHFLGSLIYISQYRFASRIKDGSGDIIEESVHYMKENIEKTISIKELSEQAGLSAPHFTMIFKKKIGHSPITYFNLLKIQRACHLLDNTDMKINQICFKIGIPDSYYFSRLFTKIMGLSPAKYRQSNKG